VRGYQAPGRQARPMRTSSGWRLAVDRLGQSAAPLRILLEQRVRTCAHIRRGPDSMARCCPDPVAHACCGEATHAHIGAEDPAHWRAGDKAISRDCAPALVARRYSYRQALMTAGVYSARIPSAGTPGAVAAGGMCATSPASRRKSIHAVQRLRRGAFSRRNQSSISSSISSWTFFRPCRARMTCI
jgi:hypothetical protein